MTAQSVQEINKEVRERCRHYGLDWDCGSDGDYNANVVIVGEAPGDKERQLKVPLVGGSGKLLWDILRPYGLSRRTCYVTNVCKRQLLSVGTKFEKQTIGDGELQLYTDILDWELAQLPNVTVVVALGTRALQALTGYTSITNYRGSVVERQLSNGRVVQVVCMNNPAHVLRQPSMEMMFRFDCARLNQVVTGTFTRYEIKEIINPTFEQARAWIKKMEDDGLPVSLDIEVSSGECICIGLANSRFEGMCINFRTDTDNRWSVTEEMQLWQDVARLVSNPSVRLVMQNGMFDASYLWFVERVKVSSFYFDTMLAHHTLYPSLPHGLGFLTTQYTTHPYYKDDGKLWKDGGNIEAEWRYNVKDACVTLACYEEMIKELKQQKLDDFFFSHVMTLQPHLVEMTVLGLKVDLDKRKELATIIKADIEQMRAEFDRQVVICTGDGEYKVNPASPKQMQKLFFETLKLVGRGVSTDKENRRRMHDHPRTNEECRKLIRIVDKLAELTKFYSTYLETELDEDGRIRSQYNQTGVQSAPGRLSSSQTGWHTGSNLQNQPPKAHEMYIADEGCIFVYFDLGQAEARSVGWRYNIKTWIDQFEKARTDASGYDAHRALASQMFNVPYDDVPKSDTDEAGKYTIRYTAKRCRHGLNYRMMPDRLATTLNVSFNEAQYLWHLYHKTNPELQKGWEWEVKTVKEKRMLFNAYGRRWILLEAFSDEATEAVVAFFHQSTIGDKVARVIYQCHNDPEWPRGHARICLNIHDALVAVTRPEYRELVQKIMKKYAEEPINIPSIDGTIKPLIIPADFKVSVPDDKGFHRWSNLEKVK